MHTCFNGYGSEFLIGEPVSGKKMVLDACNRERLMNDENKIKTKEHFESVLSRNSSRSGTSHHKSDMNVNNVN